MPPRPLLGPQPPTFLGADDPYMRVPGHENVGKPKPKAKDRRNWQQKTRDWLNQKGREYLGPHGDRAFGLLGMASEFTDAADLRDAMDYGGKLGGAVQKGDWWGAAGAAPWMLAASGAAMLPGVSVGAADEAAEGVKKGIRAYHGSPHDFDRFDMSKIGTGEGAQAYGHGLYFAESEGVAKSYQDALSNDYFLLDGERVHMPGLRDDWRAALKAEAAGKPMGPALQRALEEAKKAGFGISKGRMYEVNINADPDTFLDWDKPLSEQPEAVQKHFSHLKNKSLTGEDLARRMESRVWIDEAAQAGIPGIKYLDAGSRGVGDGTRNYVVFDDRLISIVRKYGIAGASAILGYNVLTNMDPAQAAQLQQIDNERQTGGW